MAHELGYLLRYVDFNQLDEEALRKIEKEANLFASYFALPGEELKKDFYSITDKTNPDAYIQLKEKYKISIQSIVYRAYQENWLSKEENRRFWRRLQNAGYRITEPLDNELTIYISGKIRALFSKALEVNSGLITEWLDKYAVDVEYFEKIFGIKDDFPRKYVGKQAYNYS